MVALVSPTTERRAVRWGIPADPTPASGPVAPVMWLDRIDGETSPNVESPFAGPPALWRVTVNAVATFVLVLMVGLTAMATMPLAAGYRAGSLSSGSMEPALRIGDVMVANPTIQPVVGSVIEFRTISGNRTHRVIDIRPTGYLTRGDNNPTPDADVVPASDVLGVGVLVVPFIGLPRLWFDDGRWLLLAFATLILAAVAAAAKQSWLTSYSHRWAWPESVP